jgi:hypothetical protein
MIHYLFIQFFITQKKQEETDEFITYIDSIFINQ